MGVKLSPEGCLVLAHEGSFNPSQDASEAPAEGGADGVVDLTPGVAAQVARPAR